MLAGRGPRPLSRCLAGPASAASTASTRSARVPTSRETVGSEATDPRISFSRRGERSDRQRPPRVARTAGSAMTLPGSRTDHGRRHADRAPQSSLPSPAPGRLRSAASPRPAPPQQHPRTPHPPTECNSLIFHHEDALPLKLSDLSNPHHPKRNDTPTPPSTPQQQKLEANPAHRPRLPTGTRPHPPPAQPGPLRQGLHYPRRPHRTTHYHRSHPTTIRHHSQRPNRTNRRQHANTRHPRPDPNHHSDRPHNLRYPANPTGRGSPSRIRHKTRPHDPLPHTIEHTQADSKRPKNPQNQTKTRIMDSP